MTPVWSADIVNGELVISKPEEFKTYISRLIGPLDVIVRKRRKPRSLPENNYYWGVVILIFSEFCGYEKNEMHESLIAEYSRRNSTDPVPKVLSTSAMSTAEFEDYMSWARRFGAENGLNIPMPNEVE